MCVYNEEPCRGPKVHLEALYALRIATSAPEEGSLSVSTDAHNPSSGCEKDKITLLCRETTSNLSFL